MALLPPFEHDPFRRRFMQLGVASGVSVWLARPLEAAQGMLGEDRITTPPHVGGNGHAVRGRIEGPAKVTGAKVFAMDFRARDVPGWPQQQSHAMLVRATRADRVFEGLALDALGEDLRPDRIVTAADLERDGLQLPEFYGREAFAPPGRPPAYLGEPVAMLIFHDFARFRFAKNRLRFDAGLVRYGRAGGLPEREPYGESAYVRVGGPTPFDEDEFSNFRNGVVDTGYRKQDPDAPLDGGKPALDRPGWEHARRIAAQMEHPPEGWTVFQRDYFSQQIDTAALEPDNVNGWYDREAQALHLVAATQSPIEVATEAGEMVATSRMPVKAVYVNPCYTVGYGSKDHNSFPFYGVIAGLYGEGQPVRLANDRFEQFQSALKRHAFDMKYWLAVDRSTGKFQSFRGDFVADGGGRANFSASVAAVGATAAQGIYYFPKSELYCVAKATRAVEAGSARGYGTLQSMTATELLVDEVAEALGIDAMELRARNLLLSGMKNTQGGIPAGKLRADEIIARARMHPLWADRVRRKADYERAHPERRYGVGFGCVQKDFGTGAESAFARVEVDAAGRVTLHHVGVDMGTGTATSQALVCAEWLGVPAAEVRTGVTEWPELPIETSGDPYTMKQAEQDRLARNPRWSPSYSSPSSASNSAYYFSHATREAARVVFQHGLWPAAMEIWSRGIGGGQVAPLAVRVEDARWVDGRLTARGLEPLALDRLAALARERGLVTGAIVHTFNRWQWAESSFPLGGATVRLPLDGLAVRRGDGAPRHAGTANGYEAIERRDVAFPPVQRNAIAVTYYSAIGTFVEAAVHAGTGEVEVLSTHSIMECGKPIVPELVAGQLQGGIAMGLGHALWEFLPLYEDGPGNGTWNFNRYRLPRARDVAPWKQTHEILAPLSATDAPKGIAEVVMIAVVPAAVNAVAHATGHRFRELPVTAPRIRAAFAQRV